MKIFILIAIILVNLSFQMPNALAQDGNDIFATDDDDLNIGGDIFTDFSEELENSKIVEDERFYRFGRFFSFNVGIGATWFDGNRGNAYKNSLPSYALGFTFFKDFQSALNLGLEYSKHTMFLEGPTVGFPNVKDKDNNQAQVGLIDVSMLRVYLGYRYYVDTANLGTAITYSNPYFIGRLEYWYQTLKYVDQSTLSNDTGGGLGIGLGFGLEFPIEVKESYWGLEFLYHNVNFWDKDSNRYQPNTVGGPGYADMSGNGYSTMLFYIFNW